MEVGGAIRAPNVQSLLEATISDPSVEVPDRYIRPEINDEPVVEFADLPVIDLGLLLDPGRSSDSQQESRRLHLACQEWGFFQLVNHGIPGEVIEKLKEDIEEFFKLPLKEKEELAQVAGGIEGYGPAFTLWEERKLDWGDMMFLTTLPAENRKMRFWPTRPPTFRDSLDKYSVALMEVTNGVLRSMAVSLGLDQERLINCFKVTSQSMRFNYYPACPKAADKVIGLSPHSDSDGITLLLQINDVHGLQVRKEGKWFNTEPLSGAFVVNVGDMLEMLTNGIYKSNEHRALVHKDVERISLAGFHSPSSDAMVGPLPELVKDGKEQYENMTAMEYVMGYFAKQYGKSHLESAKVDK